MKAIISSPSCWKRTCCGTRSVVPPCSANSLNTCGPSMSLPSMTLGIIPFSADRSLLHPVEMFFMFDDAQVEVELVSGWLRVTQPSEVEMYADAFRRLSEMAVYGGAARALIGQAIDAIS